jgi:tetratricopeptide (TPR) repeat protein
LSGLGSNKLQIRQSASEYRYKRLKELLSSVKKNDVTETAQILRDRRGLENADIGLGNEKAINQLIAHHSIIFEPQKKRVWVSTFPWQLGEFVCYDLDKIFMIKGMKVNNEIADSLLNIPADTFLLTRNFEHFLEYRRLRKEISDGSVVNPDSLISSNPNYYQAYQLAGNMMFRSRDYSKAIEYYRVALSKEIATKTEENEIRNQISKAEDKLKHPDH